MIWTLLALLLQVVLGGFIAYFGDLQGRRWGKKRVTLFGLRPKHTAILLTSLTGGFISLVSIATVLLVSPSVRDVVLRGEQAIRDNKRLNTELAKQGENQARQNKQNEERSASLQAEIEARRSELAEARKLTQEYRTQVASLQQQTGRLTSKYMDLQRNFYALDRTNERLQTKNAKLLGDNSRLESDNLAAADINRGLARDNLRLTRENGMLESSNNRLQTKNETLSNANTRLTANNMELKREGDKLTKANEALTRANEAESKANVVIQEKRRELEQQVAEKQSLLEEQARQLARVEKQFADIRNAFERTYLAVRQGRLNIRAGAELARIEISARTSAAEVRRRLDALLESASATALVYKGGRGDNGRAVRVVDKRFLTLSGLSGEINEDNSLDILAQVLAERSVPTVVTANTLVNSLRGEQALIELSYADVKPLYVRGELVAEREIDASQPIEQMASSIIGFLQNDVRGSAERAGILPRIDPDTGTPQVGEASPPALIALIDQVRRQKGRVLLRALAAQTLSSADPLRLEFKLGRPEGRPQTVLPSARDLPQPVQQEML